MIDSARTLRACWTVVPIRASCRPVRILSMTGWTRAHCTISAEPGARCLVCFELCHGDSRETTGGQCDPQSPKVRMFIVLFPSQDRLTASPAAAGASSPSPEESLELRAARQASFRLPRSSFDISKNVRCATSTCGYAAAICRERSGTRRYASSARGRDLGPIRFGGA